MKFSKGRYRRSMRDVNREVAVLGHGPVRDG